MRFTDIVYRKADGIAWLTINRPVAAHLWRCRRPLHLCWKILPRVSRVGYARAASRLTSRRQAFAVTCQRAQPQPNS